MEPREGSTRQGGRMFPETDQPQAWGAWMRGLSIETPQATKIRLQARLPPTSRPVDPVACSWGENFHRPAQAVANHKRKEPSRWRRLYKTCWRDRTCTAGSRTSSYPTWYLRKFHRFHSSHSQTPSRSHPKISKSTSPQLCNMRHPCRCIFRPKSMAWSRCCRRRHRRSQEKAIGQGG